MTRKEMNIEILCCECGVLTPDSWLFETVKPTEWVCGDCAGVNLTLLSSERITKARPFVRDKGPAKCEADQREGSET